MTSSLSIVHDQAEKVRVHCLCGWTAGPFPPLEHGYYRLGELAHACLRPAGDVPADRCPSCGRLVDVDGEGAPEPGAAGAVTFRCRFCGWTAWAEVAV